MTEQELTLEVVAAEAGKSEFTDYTIYDHFARGAQAKNPKFGEVLGKFASTEYKHYQFWKRYAPGEITASMAKVNFLDFLRIVLGMTFAVKYLEKHESSVVKKYRSVEAMIPEGDKGAFEEMVRDEEEHEIAFADELQGPYLKYISFIILGLADAIVEISGIHAGSLGIYKSTELTGLAGIVAGGSASIAMASAAYAQAKQGGFKGSPFISAIFTGVSYFINAVILATPYFLTGSQSVALFTSLFFAIIIIAFTSYYNSVISNSRFFKDFGELAGVMLGATAVLYLFGSVVAVIFHITI